VIQSNENESAIDNATRGLLNLGQLPVTCGLFFSLGHSTIVVVVVNNNVFGRRPCAHSRWQTVAIAISSDVYHKIDSVGEVGGIIGRAIITLSGCCSRSEWRYRRRCIWIIFIHYWPRKLHDSVENNKASPRGTLLHQIICIGNADQHNNSRIKSLNNAGPTAKSIPRVSSIVPRRTICS